MFGTLLLFLLFFNFLGGLWLLICSFIIRGALCSRGIVGFYLGEKHFLRDPSGLKGKNSHKRADTQNNSSTRLKSSPDYLCNLFLCTCFRDRRRRPPPPHKPENLSLCCPLRLLHNKTAHKMLTEERVYSAKELSHLEKRGDVVFHASVSLNE